MNFLLLKHERRKYFAIAFQVVLKKLNFRVDYILRLPSLTNFYDSFVR